MANIVWRHRVQRRVEDIEVYIFEYCELHRNNLHCMLIRAHIHGARRSLGSRDDDWRHTERPKLCGMKHAAHMCMGVYGSMRNTYEKFKMFENVLRIP